MASDEKLKRKVWRSSEIKLFLKCYLARKDEFIHVRKKRNGYGRVLEDMIEQGFSDTSATLTTLESKMRTLFLTYKSAKASKKVPSYIAPYMEYLEAIFGCNKQVENDNSLSMGISQPEILIDLPIGTLSPKSETSTNPSVSQQSPALPSPPLQPPSPPSPEAPKTSRKRKTAREKYYEDKMRLKERMAKEKLQEKRRFHHSIVETIRDIELKKLDILKESLTS